MRQIIRANKLASLKNPFYKFSMQPETQPNDLAAVRKRLATTRLALPMALGCLALGGLCAWESHTQNDLLARQEAQKAQIRRAAQESQFAKLLRQAGKIFKLPATWPRL